MTAPKPSATADAGRRGAATAAVFVWLYAVASIWHHTSSSNEVYWFWRHFDPVQTPLVIVAILTAFFAALNPASLRLFLTMVAVQGGAAFVRLPFIPDHVVIELFLAASVLLAYALLAFERRSFTIDLHSLYDCFSPAGRVLLLCMYFFGTFHKLNPGFLSLHSSCAIDFLEGYPLPSAWLANSGFAYTVIYGVLVLEFLAMLLLLSRRTKYYGMLLGIPFHIAIGLSAYGTLAHFSAFALALHALFLPDGFGERLRQDRAIPAVLKRRGTLQAITIVLVLAQVICANRGYWTVMNAIFGLFALAQFGLTVRHGRHRAGDGTFHLGSSRWLVNLLPLLFFVHCCGPYLGLSTAGTVQMFSGLRTEGGVSNHLLMKRPPQLFPYQRDIVHVVYSTDEYLEEQRRLRLGLTMTDFRRFLATREQPLELPLALTINDVPVKVTDAATARAFEEQYVEPLNYFEYKFLLLREVDLPRPLRCRH